ncbi:MAG TPA: ATP-dependent helicase, partial [Streptomyces sp.]|nr:ATP-dependent helicase [Streptomyces sp.]
MNRTRMNDRSARGRNSSSYAGKGGSRFGAPTPRRSGGPVRSGGSGRRPAAVQGEFA